MDHSMKSTRLEARRCSAILFMLVMAVYSSLLDAYADHDKAKFVSAYGVDSGKCDDAAQPCKTVNYAGLQSNKSDIVRMAAGNSNVEDVDTLFYLLSDFVPVKGLYSEASAFAKIDANNIT
jgi:hypothetical protein